MTSPLDLRSELRWLASGFLLTLCSGFGQTYFIALFAGELKAEFALSDGEFGGLYTLGTLASAVTLIWAGKLADTISVRWLGAGVLAGLALTALAMAAVASWLMLAFVLFGLRFFGQGMLTHTAMTAMGRWFNRKRGRAVSIAALGLPAAEGLLPPLAVAAAALIGWRQTWVAGASLLLVAAIPAFLVLLRYERHPSRQPVDTGSSAAVPDRHHWTRREVVRNPQFYGVLLAVLAPPFVMTAVFFNQVVLGASKGWPIALFAASFPLLAGTHVVAALAAGWLIDRFGARRLLSTYLLPLGLATVLLALFDASWILPLAMVLIGMTLGGASATQGALWPELYGTHHLGAIRSMMTAAIVLSTAVAPGLVGVLLDAGIALETQLLFMAAYCAVGAILMVVLMPGLNQIAAR
jgi:MFS family permease